MSPQVDMLDPPVLHDGTNIFTEVVGIFDVTLQGIVPFLSLIEIKYRK